MEPAGETGESPVGPSGGAQPADGRGKYADLAGVHCHHLGLPWAVPAALADDATTTYRTAT